MHYKDGTPAQHGDIVRGKGYNIPYEVIGPVIGLVPGTDSCNIRVAVIKFRELEPAGKSKLGGAYATAGLFFRNNADEPTYHCEPQVEYGTCAEFELIHRPKS